jgi:hypothetical protein
MEEERLNLPAAAPQRRRLSSQRRLLKPEPNIT